MLGEIWSFINQ